MMNKSRGEIAYNIIDIEEAPDSELIDAIKSVDQVIGVRLI